MRKLTVVVVAAIILLAGCSGGGGQASPSANSTGTPTDDISMSQPDSPSQLLNGSSGTLDNATRLDATIYNASEQLTVTSRNNTEAGTSLLELSTPDSGTVTLYSTSEYAAYRNSSSGETEYGEPGSRVGNSVGFASAFVLFGASAYTNAVSWEAAGTTTVDGQSAFVYESNSLNQSMGEEQQGLNPSYGEGSVESVDGRLVVGPDGRIYDLNVNIQTSDGRYGSEMTVRYGDVSITKPDWVDESQAP